jgi:hypothetical protein
MYVFKYFRKAVPCQFVEECGCKSIPLIHYVSHLIEHHNIPVFETNQATVFLQFTPQVYFKNTLCKL